MVGINETWNEDIRSGMRFIKRVKLQQLLVNAVRERGGSIDWDYKFRSAQKNGNETLEVHFSNGSKETVDLLVGADGGWLSARKHIPREK